MKKTTAVFSIYILFLAGNTTNAQRVGISTDQSVPDVSSVLDVKSTTLGLLIPRMTSSQRTAIANPAKGLLVFDNVTNSFWFYNGLAWTETATAASTTNYWTANGTNIFKNNAGNVGIGTNAPTSALHIKRDGEAVRIEGALSSIGFFNSSAVYKGFVWQGPGDNISLGTAVGNNVGRVELYNNGILNMSLTNLGVMEVSGTFPQVRLKQNGHVSGTFNANGFDAELSAYKPANTNDIRGNLLLQLDVNGDFGSQYAGNVGIKTDNPVNILQIGNTPGFSGNQLAIGNGTKGMSFFQNSTTSHWYSSANFALMPADGGSGNVGVGTVSPAAKLDVVGNIRLTGNIGDAAGNIKITGDVKMDNGKLLTISTGTMDMKPLCYGTINQDGTIRVATPNVAVFKTAEGVYDIFCVGITDKSVGITSMGVNAPLSSPCYTVALYRDIGVMRVITRNFNPSFGTDDCQFNFVIYN